MYGISPYIYHKDQPNVGKYIPHMECYMAKVFVSFS